MLRRDRGAKVEGRRPVKRLLQDFKQQTQLARVQVMRTCQILDLF